jgi:hypothetical protein
MATQWTKEKKLQIGSSNALFDSTIVLMDDAIELFGNETSPTAWTLETITS